MRMSRKVKHVSLEETVSVCRTLDGLLAPSLGPGARHSLLSTSTGRLQVTSSGRAVLRALHLDHPVGRLVTKAILSCHNVTGDSSKTFLAILTRALDGIESYTESGSNRAGGKGDPMVGCKKIAVSRALHEIKLRYLPRIQQHFVCDLTAQDGYCSTDYSTALDVCLNVIWTSLQGRFNAETRQTLLSLARTYLSGTCDSLNDLQDALQEVVDDFSFVCHDSPGQSALNSRVLDGVLILRDFAPKTAPPTPMLDINFALVRFPIENSCAMESDTRIQLSTFQQAKGSLSWKSVRLAKIIDALKNKQVDLVLCEEFVSESSSLLFKQKDIHVVHSIEKEDLDHLAKVTFVDPLCEEYDLVQCTGNVVGRASKVETVVSGGRRCVLLTLTEPPGGSRKLQTILLCGPTPGMCDQYAAALLCGFKGALHAVCPGRFINLNDGSEEEQANTTDIDAKSQLETRAPEESSQETRTRRMNVAVCPGGGAFELTASSILNQFAKQTAGDVTLSLTCRILSEALLAVPLRLLHNSSLPPAERSSVVQLQELLRRDSGVQLAQTEQPASRCRGIDARSGKTTLDDPRIVEPLAGKMLTLYSVLDLLQQILRIDFLIHVPLLPKNDEGEELDSN